MPWAPFLYIMQKSVPIRVVRAALEQHNKRVDREVFQIEKKIQDDAVGEAAPELEKANALLAQVNDHIKVLKDAGWTVDIEGKYSCNDKKLKMTATLSEKTVKQRIRAAKIKVPRKMSENDLILALASTGEDDVSKALDKLNILWRPAGAAPEA